MENCFVGYKRRKGENMSGTYDVNRLPGSGNMSASDKRYFYSRENMNKDRGQHQRMIKVILIVFFIILFLCVLHWAKLIKNRKGLDTWLGEYTYSEEFEHNNGESGYWVGYDIIIYKVDSKYYAELRGDGWFLQTKSLAYINGDKSSINIFFKETLPGDSLYGIVERYEEDTLMVTLTQQDGQLYSEWYALRQEHPVLCEDKGKIEGIYFVN